MNDSDQDSICAALDQRDWYTARMLMRRLFTRSPNLATAQFIMKRGAGSDCAPERISLRVAFLRSFTIEPVIPLLRALAILNGIELTVWVGGFNAYSQEILDPHSGLYEFDPHVVIFAIQAQDLAPDLFQRFSALSPASVQERIEASEATLRNLVERFRERHDASVLLHNLETPATPAAGILDAQVEDGQSEAIRAINRGLARMVRQIPGVHVLDYELLTSRHGKARWRDEQKWLSARMPISADCLGHLAEEYVRYLAVLAGRSCKALVVDLDNTLWGGVIGEDGLGGIRLGPEYPAAAYLDLQRTLLDLHDRGILLAICSKNNPDDALEVLQRHPHMILRPQHFASMRINWSDKAQNLREIADELNIGVDSLAFLDDNPAERARVGSELPEVAVLDLPEDPMGFAAALRAFPGFERLTLSSEDLARTRYYAQEIQRKGLENRVGSLEEFYRSLQMKVEIALINADTVARAAQLTQKTNQFNLTTRRYSEQDLQGLIKWEFPRLCRGGSSSLTFTGVHPRNSER
jgi:FkbH-like protein